ncbi:hypothetical protein VPNG_05681 [Cytospora leucostoma]|uniref:Uncharacterized protein n=1 Tax=Cytospora leucostoma TaxID=1230097 RepID=A0A423X0C1_9PEZI|nr:hypothetical protein VPNG_05681 [Cytospora leucostoma]
MVNPYDADRKALLSARDVARPTCIAAELSVDEPLVDLLVDVVNPDDLAYERPPGRPLDPPRDKVPVLGDQEVRHMADQCRVRGQDAECSRPEFYFTGSVWILRAMAALSAREMVLPEGRLEQERRDGLEEDLAGRPDQVHIHTLCDENLPAEDQLVV